MLHMIWSFTKERLIIDRYSWQRLVALTFLTIVVTMTPSTFLLQVAVDVTETSRSMPIDMIIQGSFDNETILRILDDGLALQNVDARVLLGKTFARNVIGGPVDSWIIQVNNSIDSVPENDINLPSRERPLISILHGDIVNKTFLKQWFNWDADSLSMKSARETSPRVLVATDLVTAERLNLSLGNFLFFHSKETNRTVKVKLGTIIHVSRDDPSLQLIAKNNEYEEMGTQNNWFLFSSTNFTALFQYLSNVSMPSVPSKVQNTDQVEHLDRAYVFLNRKKYFNPTDLEQTVRQYEQIKSRVEMYLTKNRLSSAEWLDYRGTFYQYLLIQRDALHTVMNAGPALFLPSIVLGLYLTSLWISLANPSLNSRYLWLKSRGLQKNQLIILLFLELALLGTFSSILGSFLGLVFSSLVIGRFIFFDTFLNEVLSPYLPSLLISMITQASVFASMAALWIGMNTFFHVNKVSALRYLRLKIPRFYQQEETLKSRRHVRWQAWLAFSLILLSLIAALQLDVWLVSFFPLGDLLSPLILPIFTIVRALNVIFFISIVILLIGILSNNASNLFDVITRTLSRISPALSLVMGFMTATSSQHFRRTLTVLILSFMFLFSFLIVGPTYTQQLIHDKQLRFGSDLWVHVTNPYASIIADQPSYILDDILQMLRESNEISFATPIFLSLDGSGSINVSIKVDNDFISVVDVDLIIMNISEYVHTLNQISFTYLERKEPNGPVLLEPNDNQPIALFLTQADSLNSPKIPPSLELKNGATITIKDDKRLEISFRHSYSTSTANKTYNAGLFPVTHLPGISNVVSRDAIILPMSFFGNESQIIDTIAWETLFLAKFTENTSLIDRQSMIDHLLRAFPDNLDVNMIKLTDVVFESFNQDAQYNLVFSFLLKMVDFQILIIVALLISVLGIELFFDIYNRRYEHAVLLARGCESRLLLIGMTVETLYLLGLSIGTALVFSIFVSVSFLAVLPSSFYGPLALATIETTFPSLIFPQSIIHAIMESVVLSMGIMLLGIRWISRLSLLQIVREFGE